MIRVCCAIIVCENKVFAVRRSAHMNMPGKWEFPGGKIELGESAEQCIQREIKEELNLDIEIIQSLKTVEHRYETMHIQLIPFLVKIIHGNLKLQEHDHYCWCDENELRKLDWSEADIPIMEEIISLNLFQPKS